MGFTKTLTIYCDTDGCETEELVFEGQRANLVYAAKIAKGLGWKFTRPLSYASYTTCQECSHTQYQEGV